MTVCVTAVSGVCVYTRSRRQRPQVHTTSRHICSAALCTHTPTPPGVILYELKKEFSVRKQFVKVSSYLEERSDYVLGRGRQHLLEVEILRLE